MKLFDQTMNTLEQSLNYATKRNAVITNNIANVDTPNYKSQDVVFKHALNDEISKLETKRTHPKHIPFLEDNEPFRTITKKNTLYNHNQNNVDMDKEMSDLAKNQIYYRSLIDRMNGKLSNLQTVIRGGR
ncbi:flagellar basal body rod protein FlgB [Pseudogracilibacillus auburnensis]|uniref:Flagellar basal body rod protein FlgB n=1 Tax=Pseudogracilibacillus auburnensis TaxID=1494959 RepID=A0A2V3W6E7_9BACI|nr:flagellar basal body rod protein FlgB [Pseudogracilibacillus auburnensis]MBO1003813.1 flagellar basal body rod protein FlgB [Pseudogracilibacillus auburnensis]PXW88601.1 flagellar basal-body rod protein FlgB [Pseudogracilibacillus auburnensis]